MTEEINARKIAYIVQGHRFNIFEVIGCYPAIYNTVPTYFLVYMWPVVVGLISAVYCGKCFRSNLLNGLLNYAYSPISPPSYCEACAISRVHIVWKWLD